MDRSTAEFTLKKFRKSVEVGDLRGSRNNPSLQGKGPGEIRTQKQWSNFFQFRRRFKCPIASKITLFPFKCLFMRPNIECSFFFKMNRSQRSGWLQMALTATGIVNYSL